MAEQPPFDSPHIYVQWGGKLPGNEQWSCGFRMRKKTAGVVDSGAGLLVGVSAALATFHTSAGACISSAAKLSYVKVNAVGINGRYVENNTNQAIYADTPGAVTGQQYFPHQIALVVSLLTGFTRGTAHRGRFYLPLPAISLGSDGLMSTSAQATIDTAAETLRTNVNAVNADYEMAVFSRKDNAPGNRRVTSMSVGRVLDTQRRRRRALVEAYS